MGKRKQGEREDENVHEVEAIRAIRLHKGKVLYLLKWKGWPESCNTWEPRSNLVNCKAALRAFEKRQELEGHVSPPPLHHPPSHHTSSSLDIVPSEASSFQLKKGRPGFKRSVRQALAERRSKTEEQLSLLKANSVGADLEDNRLSLVEANKSILVEASKRGLEIEVRKANLVEASKTSLVEDSRRQVISEASKHAQAQAQAEEVEASNNQIIPGTKVKRVLKAVRYTPGPADGSKRDLRVIFKVLRSDDVEVQLDNKFLRKFYPTKLLDFYEDRVKHGKATS